MAGHSTGLDRRLDFRKRRWTSAGHRARCPRTQTVSHHPQWSRVRDETKYGRAIQFGESLGAIRKRVDADLASAGLTRERVLATIVRLPELTFIRVGNSEYARSNKSFGLTTWQDRHVQIAGAKVVFRFRGMPFVPMTSMNISGQLRKMNSPRRIFARGLERC